MATLTKDILSVGEIARELSASVSSVLKAAAAAKVSPVLNLDRVPHFAASDLDAIDEQLPGPRVSRR